MKGGRTSCSAKGELGEDCNLPPLGEKGLHMVCFITALICGPAGKVMFLAHFQPCHFRHELLVNIQRIRGSGGPASSLAVCNIKDLCMSRSAGVLSIQRGARVCREGTGARYLLTRGSNPMPALYLASAARFPQLPAASC